MKKNLFVHIGHGKTGTSAIQSMLAANRTVLGENGVQYPFHKSMEHAARGGITSGNGALLLNDLDGVRFDGDDVVFSGESLFFRLGQDGRRRILEKAESLGYDVVFVCYTRNFFEHSFSAWGQNIKRGGGTMFYEDFLEKKYRVFDILLRWIAASSKGEFRLRVFNYDRVKTDLNGHFLRSALGRGDLPEKMASASSARVNRSLTMAEYELQRQFNVFYEGKSYPFVSDVLVEHCPDIRSEVPFIDRDSHARIAAKYEGLVSEINRSLDAEDRIVLTPHEELYGDGAGPGGDRFCFSQEQLRVLAKSLSAQLNGSGRNG
ncbi:hypothetical protein [Jannaschia seohaensis]|uniref:Sulfotransferase family protein n=1 Tax=Jannaschia seohaensis TaxID=475081 RepID=A0A2Y9B2N0_9RHOB|nr:hypothetical protein [Jannaschia seohaensis]PWJ12918.1 hypothetical protein BCF38_11554 [Jannaschia seohaensis]SSA50726.1 hypothetical protein SAMN05421539_11554 [Jannaschia seohaensis]